MTASAHLWTDINSSSTLFFWCGGCYETLIFLLTKLCFVAIQQSQAKWIRKQSWKVKARYTSLFFHRTSVLLSLQPLWIGLFQKGIAKLHVGCILFIFTGCIVLCNQYVSTSCSHLQHRHIALCEGEQRAVYWNIWNPWSVNLSSRRQHCFTIPGRKTF